MVCGDGASPRYGAPYDREMLLGGLDIRSLLALGARGDVKSNPLTFLERLESRSVDSRVVREEVLSTILGGDEAEALCVVEPFDCACCHCVSCFPEGDIFRPVL